MNELSKDMQEYFESIEKEVAKTYDVASKARKKGFDPVDKVELPLAKNMFERVEGLISVAAPQIKNTGIPKRIAALEKKYGSLDWRVALTIAKEVAEEKFCKFKDKKTAIEVGIRIGFAYLTLGTVSSPLEGFVELRIKKRQDGKEYLALRYSGPVRSAGGTAAAVSVLLSDYLRKSFGFHPYDATEKEIKRMSTELYDYHERVTNLQYLPSKEEIEFMVKNLPVQIDGDPSEKIEVSNHKDLPRIETNRIRSGVCLVLGESLAQKAKKVSAKLSTWAKDFGMEHWSFLEEFLKIQKKKKAKGSVGEKDAKVSPVYTYIEDLVAGRPVLTHPLRTGGFRLRYGRSRTSGYSAASINPATTHILNKYIAIGTQLKVERPGKAATITTCDTIEGPIVKLDDGSVVRVETPQKAKEVVEKTTEILFLGDILFNYGDFYNRAHTLLPAGYCEEWWVQELEKATVNLFGTIDLDKLSELVEIPSNALEVLLKNPLTSKLTAQAAINFSTKLDMPLYPRYTYYWNTISAEQLKTLVKWIEKAKIVKSEDKIQKVVLPLDQEAKRILELLGTPHTIATNEFVVIEKDDALAFVTSLGITPQTNTEELIKLIEENSNKGTLEIINLISKVKLRDKAGVFIGARMGRPEKAKMRKLTGSPHVLFPVGEEGGKLRSFQSAFDAKKVRSDFPIYICPKCGHQTVLGICEKCSTRTERKFYCNTCGIVDKEKCQHGATASFKKQDININQMFADITKNLGFNIYPDLIKGVRGTSNKDHTPEHLAKGILRARHEVAVNKDGTTRYDMTQLPITHFRPSEINVPVEKLKELGYKTDIHNKPLTDQNQILELKPQDIILPACKSSPDLGADKILLNISRFIDELLVRLYGLKPFYNFKSDQDIVGALAVALAPHTSAGIICRIIGFSQTLGFLAHPLLHATTRRDCDGDEASIMLLMDSLINFSRNFLPDNRGATQDAPLVLTSRSIPSEVDDMVFDLDVAWKYPLEFYEACSQYKMPWEVEIEQLGKRLGTELQYEKMGFTHNTSDINAGIKCSAYKTLPSMEEKLLGQMDLAEKIRAVDTEDVARLVIEKHFLRDIKGNLRKFSTQQFRCVGCNEKFRRPPLVGKCTKCGGKIIFTVSEGFIIKYLEPAISMAEKYNLPDYLKLNLELTKRRVEGIFGKEKEKQEGLGKWFTPA
ncbi:DNA polymerase II large subunit [Candidatus Woesearchaeota archaeon]|nr:DNA polymerase II large subunit [Candidatus Woesearchaeota archaeon]